MYTENKQLVHLVFLHLVSTLCRKDYFCDFEPNADVCLQQDFRVRRLGRRRSTMSSPQRRMTRQLQKWMVLWVEVDLMELSLAAKSPEEGQPLIPQMTATTRTGSLKMTGKSNRGKSM